MIILDAGHGKQTPGKRSPVFNGVQILEYEYARKLVTEISRQLLLEGIYSTILVPTDDDMSLNERCIKANKLAKISGTKNTLLVSVHLNAANGRARGWEVHTFKGQSISDVYASIFWKEAKNILKNTPMRGDHSDGDPDWDSNFAILRDTICPAILTENLFMDNESDFNILNSAEGFNSIVKIHVEAIKKINGLS